MSIALKEIEQAVWESNTTHILPGLCKSSKQNFLNQQKHKMIKPPRIYANYVIEEGYATVGVFRDYKRHPEDEEYIRRDLIQAILIRVHLHEARRDDIKLDQIIDEVIENKNKK